MATWWWFCFPCETSFEAPYTKQHQACPRCGSDDTDDIEPVSDEDFGRPVVRRRGRCVGDARATEEQLDARLDSMKDGDW